MPNEEIITALKNAIAHGESLQDAAKIMIDSGYDVQEVHAASSFVGSGSMNIQEPEPELEDKSKESQTKDLKTKDLPPKETAKKSKSKKEESLKEEKKDKSKDEETSSELKVDEKEIEDFARNINDKKKSK